MKLFLLFFLFSFTRSETVVGDLSTEVKPLKPSIGYSSVIAIGDGLAKPKLNVPSYFDIYGVEDRELSVRILGPVSPEYSIKSYHDHKKITYTLTVPGIYEISVKVDGISIVDSPWSVRVGSVGTVLPKPKPKGEVIVSGKGLKKGIVNQWNLITIDTNPNKYGSAKVIVEGPINNAYRGARILVKQTGFQDNVVNFFYKVDMVGEYRIKVTYNNYPVRDSPWIVSVISDDEPRSINPPLPKPTTPEESVDPNPSPDRPPRPSAHDVVVIGEGIKGAVAEIWNEFIVDCSSAGPGSLAVVMSGPAKVEWQSEKLSSSRFRYRYRTMATGEYLLRIDYNDVSIKESPIKILVRSRIPVPPTRPRLGGNVKASGDGLKEGIVGRWNSIVLDTNGVDPGELTVSIAGAGKVEWEKYSLVHGIVTYLYRPMRIGHYDISIKLAGVHIPGSPFSVVCHH